MFAVLKAKVRESDRKENTVIMGSQALVCCCFFFVCLFVLLCFALLIGYMYVDNGRNDPKYLGNKIFLKTEKYLF